MSKKIRLYALLSALLFGFGATSAMAVGGSQQFVSSGCEGPSYDQRTLNDEQQGLVKLSFLLDEHGKVVDAKIVESSGFRNLDKASMRALKACQFQADKSSTSGWNNVSFAWVLK
ncbi:energy transducer TonB [Undibacterium sp. TJN19]|uniref:energy transducer TonB n=1 Tax=Undibacterium sp. TJN19 TaxID=3413055 RepID=UPI003BF403C6